MAEWPTCETSSCSGDRVRCDCPDFIDEETEANREIRASSKPHSQALRGLVFKQRHWPLTGNKAWGWWAGLQGLLTPAPPPGDGSAKSREAGTIPLIYSSSAINHTIWMPHACLVSEDPQPCHISGMKGQGRWHTDLKLWGRPQRCVQRAHILGDPPSRPPLTDDSRHHREF